MGKSTKTSQKGARTTRPMDFIPHVAKRNDKNPKTEKVNPITPLERQSGDFGCKFTLTSGLTSSCELSVCVNAERGLLFLEILEGNSHLQEPWFNSNWNEDDLKPKLRHWLDSHQIGQMLLHAPEHQENAVVSPLSHRWPLVLERVNELFRLPEATEESRRANAIYHLLQGSQPTGTLLSALLSEGRLGNEEED
jgi:hypothetical protein